MSNTDSDRRAFLLSASGASAAGLAALSAATAEAEPIRVRRTLIQPGNTVLFQGDSITDAGRKRDITGANSQEAFGTGYAWMAASQMLVSRPELELNCYNRGISGNKVFQLAERWQTDCLDLKPNVLSILIGVNDIWHKLNGNYDGTADVYENDYNAHIDRTMEALPYIEIVICEPFVLNCGAVNADWFPEFNTYRTAARRVAERTGAVFVPFQEMFDRAIAHAPPEHWAKDGVHPTDIGHALMAHAWLDAVGV